MAIGRPTKYNKKLGTEICKRIAEGESLRTICKGEGMPVISTVMLWVLDPEKKEFSEQYARARDLQAEVLFEEALDIADQGEDVNRDRLRVDTRKWYVSKVKPKKFGEKLDLTTDGKPLLISSDE